MTTPADDQFEHELKLLGIAQIYSTKIEFLLYGLASIFAKTPQGQRDKRFRSLDSETFFRGNPAQLKATLGQLLTQFGDAFLLSSGKINKFVDDRNLIAHNYWRTFHGTIRGVERRTDATDFLVSYIERSRNFESVLLGFLRMSIEAAAKSDGREAEFPARAEDDANVALFMEHAIEHLAGKRGRSNSDDGD